MSRAGRCSVGVYGPLAAFRRIYRQHHQVLVFFLHGVSWLSRYFALSYMVNVSAPDGHTAYNASKKVRDLNINPPESCSLGLQRICPHVILSHVSYISPSMNLCDKQQLDCDSRRPSKRGFDPRLLQSSKDGLRRSVLCIARPPCTRHVQQQIRHLFRTDSWN